MQAPIREQSCAAFYFSVAEIPGATHSPLKPARIERRAKRSTQEYPKIGRHRQSSFARPDRDDATQERANPPGGHSERYHSDCQPQLLKQTVPRKRRNRLNFQQVIKGAN